MTALVIAAGGSSQRMGAGIPKQYMRLDGALVLEKAIRAFCGFPEITQIIIAADNPGFAEHMLGTMDSIRRIPGNSDAFRDISIVQGGSSRQESIANALAIINPEIKYVLIHDAARPFVTKVTIGNVLDALHLYKAVVPCVRPKSTIRTVKGTLNRNELFEVQTPQGFHKGVILEAYKKSVRDGFTGTDDASLTEHMGVETHIVVGDYSNIKITTPEDIPKMNEIRIGTGYDVHKLVKGRPLMLGCISIPFEKGLLGHSDADVLSHAIADALLGAAALGDIGKHFPDTDSRYEGMSGAEILRKTMEIVRDAGWEIVNVDSTIAAQKPKLAPYINEMRSSIATALGSEVSRISVKATTEEGLGITGSGEAITASAVVSIRSI